MELVKKLKFPNYFKLPQNQILLVNPLKRNGLNLHEYFNKISKSYNLRGKYMIKKEDLKYLYRNRYMTNNKRYFCYANAGVCFNSKKQRQSGIFYLNSFRTAVTLTKKLIIDNSTYNTIFSIVNRKTGITIYVIPKNQYYGESSKDKIILIK